MCTGCDLVVLVVVVVEACPFWEGDEDGERKWRRKNNSQKQCISETFPEHSVNSTSFPGLENSFLSFHNFSKNFMTMGTLHNKFHCLDK